MCWVMVEEKGLEKKLGSGEGRVGQVLWNHAAARIGLEGVTVTARYADKRNDRGGDGDGGAEGLERECVLLWNDKPVEGLPDEAQLSSNE
jgi:hypothetical protein